MTRKSERHSGHCDPEPKRKTKVQRDAGETKATGDGVDLSLAVTFPRVSRHVIRGNCVVFSGDKEVRLSRASETYLSVGLCTLNASQVSTRDASS